MRDMHGSTTTAERYWKLLRNVISADSASKVPILSPPFDRLTDRSQRALRGTRIFCVRWKVPEEATSSEIMILCVRFYLSLTFGPTTLLTERNSNRISFDRIVVVASDFVRA